VETLVAIILALVTAVLAAGGTYWTTRRNLQVQYDADLRKLRIDAYQDLWARMMVLAKYGRPETLVRQGAVELGEGLKDWYFTVGGIFLSIETRRDYFTLQEAIEAVAHDESGGWRLTQDEDDFLRVLASRLRTGTIRDVGTRETFMFRRDVEPSEIPEAHTFKGGDDRRLKLSWGSRSPSPDRRREDRRRRRGLARGKIDADVAFPNDDRKVRNAHWDVERSLLTVTFADGDGPPRSFLYEDGDLIEGPANWKRRDGPPPSQALTWRREASSDEGDWDRA